MEYIDIVEEACKIKGSNPAERLAYIAAFSVAQMTVCEHSTTKPFNPLLGETYEFINNKIQTLSELVCHHPPITANIC